MVEFYKDEFVERCPFCGGEEMIETFQAGYASVTATSNRLGGCALYHSVCRSCGSIVRSYVKNPEKLLKRSERKENY